MTDMNDFQFYEYPGIPAMYAPLKKSGDTIVISQIGKGLPGEKGDKGDPGGSSTIYVKLDGLTDEQKATVIQQIINAIGESEEGITISPTVNITDLTEEQIGQIAAQLANVVSSVEDAIVTTTDNNTHIIAIPFDDYNVTDLIWVDIEGLTLSEGTDYSIYNNQVVLATTIEKAGTRVHFRRFKYVMPIGDKYITVNQYTNRVLGTQYHYAQTETRVQPSDSEFSSNIPEAIPSWYMWTRVTVHYSDGADSVSYSVVQNGATGPKGDTGQQGPKGDTGDNGTNGTPGSSASIDHTDYYYAQTSSGTTRPSDSAFSSTIPEAIAGYYMWTKTVIVYSDGTEVPIYSVSLNGANGQDGQDGGGDGSGTTGADAYSYFGESTTDPTVTNKVARITGYDVEPTMHKGLVVDVFFSKANSANSPTLTIEYRETANDSYQTLCTNVPIYIQGSPGGYWVNNTTVTMVYTGSAWYIANTPVFGSSATIGNPAGGHVYIDGDSIDLNMMDAANQRVTLTHFGYGPGKSASGSTATAPYYTLGSRAANSAVGNFSTAIGNNNTASGYVSYAEGSTCVASGTKSHAEGQYSTASGEVSHAEGQARATGQYTHAEGYFAEAQGQFSHAEGYSTLASGLGSHAQGCKTTAQGEYQFVAGKANKIDSNDEYAMIIGNGTNLDGVTPTRHNAFSVDWSGHLLCDEKQPFSLAGSTVAQTIQAGKGAGFDIRLSPEAGFVPIAVSDIYTNHQRLCSIGGFQICQDTNGYYIHVTVTNRDTSELYVQVTAMALCTSLMSTGLPTTFVAS